MKNILIISGKKQSGKNSLAAFLTGYMMKKYTRESGLEEFGMHVSGQLTVPLKEAGDDYDFETGHNIGILDIFRTDSEYKRYAANKIWPYTKCYNFAEPLKIIATDIFGLKKESVWGTDEQKNQWTHIKFDKLKKFASDKYQERKGGYVSGREFLEILGTDVFRHIYSDCWVEFCYNQIQATDSKLHVIFDARFPNEIDFFKKMAEDDIETNVKVIRLQRKLESDEPESDVETALDDYPDSNYDFILNNQDLTMQEKNLLVVDQLMRWGMIEIEV